MRPISHQTFDGIAVDRGAYDIRSLRRVAYGGAAMPRRPTFQRIADLTVETAGAFAAVKGEVRLDDASVDVLASFYKARPPTIHGGTNEIQRNILAQQVLGLPRR